MNFNFFNKTVAILNAGCDSTVWLQGIIVPIHKKVNVM